MAKETRCRSLLKSIGWRIIATGTTFTIAYIIEGDLDIAAKIGTLDCSVKFILNYAYERGFANLKWGGILMNIPPNLPLYNKFSLGNGDKHNLIMPNEAI